MFLTLEGPVCPSIYPPIIYSPVHPLFIPFIGPSTRPPILVSFSMPALGSPYLPGPLVGNEDAAVTKTDRSSWNR